MRGMDDGDVRQRQNRHGGRKESAEDVDPKHHLLASDFVSRKDLVLGRVGSAIESQVDEEVPDSNHIRVGGLDLGSTTVFALALLLIPHAHEDGDAGCDHEDNEVLVRRELAAVEEDVHYHDGDKLAGFSKHHGGVGDVRECCEAERCGGGDEDRALEVSEEQSFGRVPGV